MDLLTDLYTAKLAKKCEEWPMSIDDSSNSPTLLIQGNAQCFRYGPLHTHHLHKLNSSRFSLSF